MKKGFVSLVGAGPGDPELLTLKALRRIREADLIIYDYLVNPEHLRHAKKNSTIICVGKGFRHKLMSQQKINRRIIREAKHGKSVVRLKGGDPYLFGRGAEEALFLKKHGIPFDVVPGITSALACANYAGIPLTHREHNSSVTFLTGHRAHDLALDSIDWRRIAAMPGTLVVYMGFYNLPTITRRLIANGMRSDTPVAVIEWGTLPRQKTCTSTLKNIGSLVTRMKLEPPCLIVIGDVVRLQDKLNWYERLPLFGKKILVTRTQDKAGKLSSKLQALGAETIELPTIEIGIARDFGPLDTAIRELSQYDWVVFTSSYAMDAFFERLSRLGKDARWLKDVRIASVGPDTATALRARGLEPDALPKDSESASIPDAIRAKAGSLKNLSILLVRTNIAPVILEDRLRQAGARPHPVTGYVTKIARPDRLLLRRLTQDPPDYLTFTSSSTAKNLTAILGKNRMKRLAECSSVVSVGPKTSQTLRSLGLRVKAQASDYCVDGLVSAILKDVRRKK